MEPVVTNSASNTCPNPISSNCVQVPIPIPGTQNVCYPATLTTVIASLGTILTGGDGSIGSGVGGAVVPGIDLGCLYSTTVGTCPTGWTYVPASGSVAAHCSNGCPPGFRNGGLAPDGTTVCIACPSISPCPAPAPTYIANPNPSPTTLAGILQAIVDFLQPFCNCNPCASTSASAGPNRT